ncbi:unnamed protein product, partial [Iphiclides podalirius]
MCGVSQILLTSVRHMMDMRSDLRGVQDSWRYRERSITAVQELVPAEHHLMGFIRGRSRSVVGWPRPRGRREACGSIKLLDGAAMPITDSRRAEGG